MSEAGQRPHRRIQPHPAPDIARPAARCHTPRMAFRVLIAGGRLFSDYPRLRAALDALLTNRLPDVQFLTGGGPGVPMLAASYATANGLTVHALPPDFTRFPVDAVERRDAFLVAEADAVVVVWDGCDPAVARVLKLAERKGAPVHVIGGPPRKSAGVKRTADPEEPGTRRGLPD